MLILAIDCAQRFCAVALHDSATDTPIASRCPDIGRGHAELLPGIVAEVLALAGTDLAAVERLVVTTGPGSFAGIRVGVAFARGLALALSVPCVGVPTLMAMAQPLARVRDSAVMVALDARREHVWCAVVNADGGFAVPPCELKPEAAALLAATSDCLLAGSAAGQLVAIEPALQVRLAGGGLVHPDAPSIEAVARIGAGLDPAAYPPQPLYLRDPDAKPQAGFALAREA
ncbi:tRNA threonylcarbamoyladenosine biosynthesis protein TsaB [Hoeflea marina]|uniref:tRNA threonylcarbamoyladenosine biosynthesis protein TsaB n=1 Tax=Hoeflea marina TaxID=274592 RepID=A0A317PKI9_9HYPH|nr:tRNA (adenosine(37)-N6)-threonylcarbamoyltransferase complex dimerization subunit type 1 TsaB [Hoeflea marina]PWW00175.1 tRNA threonylcarbamoyladenosine biosynthesis protein TsaB [Hoeflea marina]